MAREKDIKHEVSDLWKLLKQERRARSKLVGAADLAESSRRLARIADDLKKLSARMAWRELAASQPIMKKPKKSAAGRPKSESPPPRKARKSRTKDGAVAKKSGEPEGS